MYAVGDLRARLLQQRVLLHVNMRHHLRVRTAFGLNTLAHRFRQVNTSVLVANHRDQRTRGVTRPDDATGLATTEASAASASYLLANASLLRLGSRTRLLNRRLSRLARVGTLVNGVMRGHLTTVTLGLRVTSFRVGIRIINCLANACRDHVLTYFNLLMLLSVGELRLAVSATRLMALGVSAIFLGLLGRGSSRGHCGAGVVSKVNLCYGRVALLSDRVITIRRVTLSNILRLRLGRVNVRSDLQRINGPICRERLGVNVSVGSLSSKV